MKSFYKILLIIFCAQAAFSQEKQKSDSVKISYVPTGLRIGTDLISLVKSQTSDKFKGWEVNFDTDLLRYHIAADYGSWSRQLTLPNGDYSNDGTYLRLGVDINFLLKDPDRNMFFIGFRYGMSRFSEEVLYQYEDTNYGAVVNQLQNDNRSARWGEMTTGLRVKLWKELWMGYTARFKFAPSVSGGDATFETYDIPGYGLAGKNIYWGFNYQIFWRFAWKKNLGPIRIAK